MDNLRDKLYLMLRLIRKNEDNPDYDILNDAEILHLNQRKVKHLLGIAACEGLVEEPDSIELNHGRTILSGQTKITEKGYKFLKIYLAR